MKELFNLLKLSPNTSKEEVKIAFLNWKKEQQQILKSGKQEEQKLVTERITKVTILYKEFMGNNESSYNPTNKTKYGSNFQNKAKKLSSESNLQQNIEKRNQQIIGLTCFFVVIALCFWTYSLLKEKMNISIFPQSSNSIISIFQDNSPFSKKVENIKIQEPLKKPQIETKKIKPQESSEQPKVEVPKKEIDKNPGKTQPQRDAIQVLLNFHDGITRKDLRRSYNCLSKDFQNHMSYEGWTPGFDTTVSSEVSDIKITSESGNKIVLTYVLKAVDNIKGKQEIAYFNGTVDIINEGGNWKIDGIKNKVR